jgi:gliding motility-associated lipoprotein GldB
MKQVSTYKHYLLFFVLLFFISCKDKEVQVAVEDIPNSVDITIERFDQLYKNVDEKKLAQLKQDFPFLFSKDTTDAFWLAKPNDKYFKELTNDVLKKYPDTKFLEEDIENMLSRVAYYFPNEKKPRVITLVNELIEDKRALFLNDYMFICLDMYLGQDYKYYASFPNYQSQNFNKDYILPDLLTNFGYRKVKPSQDKTLISEMIYYGKIHYLKDVLIPNYKDFQKIGYTEQQYNWCKANEAQIWAYFIDKKLLYDNNIKNSQRFIEKGPFTKFGLELDKESPGAIGQWLGWQIVKSYMAENDVPLDKMLTMEAIDIFNDSNYKPESND